MLCVVLMLVFDDDDRQKEDAYEDVYTTMKRVQEIINRRSVEATLDDCGKLSETLCKLVDSCTGPNVMMWSENPRVSAVNFNFGSVKFCV